MCGTVTAVFPAVAPDSIGGWIGCVGMFIAGLCVSAGFQFLGKKMNVNENPKPLEELNQEYSKDETKQ